MTIRILSILLAIILIVESTYASFPDTVNSFYRDSVHILSDEGIISGFSDGTFGPDKTITRAEILKIYLKAKGVAVGNTNMKRCFKDVGLTLWYSDYICE